METKLTKKLMAVDSWTWSVMNRVKLVGNIRFTASGREYQREIMQSRALEKCIIKGSQVGITTIFILDCCHGLIHHKFPQGVIYYFPTTVSAEMFGKTRMGPIVSNNPCIGKYLGGDSLTVKMVGDSPLRLLGAKATHVIDGSKDASTVRSEPADYLIRDERDLFDDDMADQTIQRLGNSEVNRQVDLGTPKTPDRGIDSIWQRSTQNHREIKCRSCNSWTCLERDFPNSIRFGDNGAYRACSSCGKEIYLEHGQWVRKYEKKQVEGWWVSQLLNPHANLGQIMDRWERVQDNATKLGEFYNSVLGRSYIAAENRLTIQDVYACCGQDSLMPRFSGPCSMGVDVQGSELYVVIGTNSVVPKVIYVGTVREWGQLHDLGLRFGVRCAVVDIRPESHRVREFAAAEKYPVWACAYLDRSNVYLKEDEKKGILSVSRTEHCDMTHQAIVDRKVELPRRCTVIDEFARQMCNSARVNVEDKLTGGNIYRYVKVGDQDDYRHAFNYWWLSLRYTSPVDRAKSVERDEEIQNLVRLYRRTG